jgi:hypothetical protein
MDAMETHCNRRLASSARGSFRDKGCAPVALDGPGALPSSNRPLLEPGAVQFITGIMKATNSELTRPPAPTTRRG